MDAMLSQRTIDLIKQIRGKPFHLHNNTIQLMTTSTHSITLSESVAIKHIRSLIEQGRKVVVPCTSAKQARAIHKLLVDKFPTKSFLLYTSKTPDEIKSHDFANVNEAWFGHDALIYTPTTLHCRCA
eukprot:Phypoly_transcript_13256.p3 GENE.Phypoly_transcript_13256~~Phypoly_transcript_13256.p3  ORF type:complete len:127 (-),score=11.62 Phypoly_transcript_13256:493-873(-)